MPVVTAIPSPTNAPYQHSDGNSEGQLYGIDAADPQGFFGTTPIVQPPSQGSLTGIAGTVTVAQVTCTPASVAPNTTAEQAFAVTGAATGQVVAVQKPTTQAGLGIVNARVSASGSVSICFANDTAATITPTETETYTFELFASAMAISATLTPAAVGPDDFTEQQFSVGGLAANSAVIVNKPTTQAGLGIVGARMVSAGLVGITFGNFTAATITPTAGEVYRFVATPGLRIAPVMETLYPTLTPVSVAPNTTAEQSFTVTGVPAAGTVVVSAPEPTSGLGIVNARVSALNTIYVAFANNTSTTITPPGGVYAVALFPAASPGAGDETTFNAQMGGQDHSALVELGLVAGP